MVNPTSLQLGSGGGLSITMIPGASWLEGQLSRYAGDIRSLRDPLEEAVDDVVRPAIGENFASESEAGAGWQSLAEDTPFMPYRMEHGAGNNPILDVTGKLKRVAQQKGIWSFQGGGGQGGYMEVPYSAFDASGVRYGPVHQEGARNLGLKGGLADVPARPFMSINEEHINSIEEIFADWMDENFGKRLGSGKRIGVEAR